MKSQTFFHYKPGNTLLHKVNPSIKILLLLLSAIASFYLPWQAAALLWLFIIACSAMFLHFSVHDILSDIKPALIYLIMLYIASVIGNILEQQPAFADISLTTMLKLLIPSTVYLPLLAHLSLAMEITAVFYRTTSTQQFNEGFSAIERCITRKDETPFADMIALTITFIPRLASFWSKIDTAWHARSGSNNLRRITTLTPVLFRTSMREAWEKSKARENRT